MARSKSKQSPTPQEAKIYKDTQRLKLEAEGLSSGGNGHGDPGRPLSGHIKKSKHGRTEYSFTDAGNAERLVSLYGDVIRHSPERNMWLVFTGKRWEWDVSGKHITRMYLETIRDLWKVGYNQGIGIDKSAILKHIERSEGRARREGTLSYSREQPTVPISNNELDRDLLLFNCKNGTIELKSGKLRSHRKEDLLTVLVPYDYKPEVECPRWLEFLDQVTGGDKDLQGYLQRATGYSLTGVTKSQVLFFLYGLGNNGKSTFITTVRSLLGGYAGRANTDIFMVRDKGGAGHREDLANIEGKRFISASELVEGKRLDVSLVKDITGGETIRASRKYEHETEFLPQAKIWLIGNHKPVITDTTLSIWRRVKLIPFTVTIADSDVDPDLPAKLETELPGILAWAVKGCLSWQRGGLQEPPVITNATKSYRKEEDILGDFLDDCCVVEQGAMATKVELRESYTNWCNKASVDPISTRKFRDCLMERGVSEVRYGTGRYWVGVRLRDASFDEDLGEL